MVGGWRSLKQTRERALPVNHGHGGDKVGFAQVTNCQENSTRAFGETMVVTIDMSRYFGENVGLFFDFFFSFAMSAFS